MQIKPTIPVTVNKFTKKQKLFIILYLYLLKLKQDYATCSETEQISFVLIESINKAVLCILKRTIIAIAVAT